MSKFTFSKSLFSQKSHFQSLIFGKIHNFKVSFFTKFPFSKFHFSQNSHFSKSIFHKMHIFQKSNNKDKYRKISQFSFQLPTEFSERSELPNILFLESFVRVSCLISNFLLISSSSQFWLIDQKVPKSSKKQKYF